MRFISRISTRQSTPDPATNRSSSPPSDIRADLSEQPTSSSINQHRMSKDSEGYPSWLPKRPPHPAPRSTFQSSVALPEAGPSEPNPVGEASPVVGGGRKATPRSVRIVSLHDNYGYGEKNREPTDQTRVPSNPLRQARAWSRATAPAMYTSTDSGAPRAPQPKFRSRGLHLELLQSPSPNSRLYFYLFRLFVFLHIPLQCFFDFNTVFILFQVSKFPNPEAPGVPGSGRNWSLGAAAYIACWLVWILVVCVVYDLIYSFARRWRVKRPAVYPLYLSAPAFNLISVSSYTNFCFFQHLRHSAFVGELGSLRNGLAETFWFYSQNLPTVALLLPRAGLSLALLLAFSSPQTGIVALADAGISHRDGTFFRVDDGTLTKYARGILITNAVWTAWRFLVLIFSLIGLWIVSGQAGGGLCGPRHRWEEEEAEKTMSVYSDNLSELDDLPWNWRECTRLRIIDAFEFCMTVKSTSRWSAGHMKETTANSALLGPTTPMTAEPFDNMQQILAAVGLGSAPPPARRGVLTDDFFQGPDGELIPRTDTPPELSADIIPKVVKRPEKNPSSPMMSLPYPFTASGARASSEDRVPFPPSPLHTSEKLSSESPEDEEEDEEEEEDEDEDDENEAEDEAGVVTSEEPSSGRASGSMSSLGNPVSSRYPFQFRRPPRGPSLSSGATSNLSPHSHSNSHSHTNSRSIQSRVSQATQSTGNRESTDSHSPRSHYTTSSGPASPASHLAGIPMPPRHPRARAGTVPVPSAPSTPSPVVFPRARARTRAESSITESFGGLQPELSAEEDSESDDNDDILEQPEPEGSHEEAEGDDVVGLLSNSRGPSPRTSLAALRHRASSSFSQVLSHSSRSGSDSRTHSHSSSSASRSRANSSIAIAVRSRAQSLVQSVGAASHSSIELVQTAIRSRANSSRARLEEDVPYHSDGFTHSRSGSGSDALLSSSENHTFGQPLPRRTQWQNQEERVEEEGSIASSHQSHSRQLSPLNPAVSASSLSASHQVSERTATPPPLNAQGFSGGLMIPDQTLSESSSRPDISTAVPSFVTAPVSIEGATTDDSGRTISSWGGISHMLERSDGTSRPA